MVAHGSALSPSLRDAWGSLEIDGPPSVVWVRPVERRRVVLLLGAFDPPTLAHVALAAAASRVEAVPAALCLTRVLLARPSDELLPPVSRLVLLKGIANARGFGLAIANRGTYLDVQRALAVDGIDATFVIGSDKLSKLEDPSFYEDGEAGVRSTFEDVKFLVVPRGGVPVTRDDLRVLDASDVFEDDDVAAMSSTEVRRVVRAGGGMEGLVPPEVAVDLAGYTSAK